MEFKVGCDKEEGTNYMSQMTFSRSALDTETTMCHLYDTQPSELIFYLSITVSMLQIFFMNTKPPIPSTKYVLL